MPEAGDTTASQERPCPDRADTLGETDHAEPLDGVVESPGELAAPCLPPIQAGALSAMTPPGSRAPAPGPGTRRVLSKLLGN